ncbi:MAG: hypothetical protein RIS66_147 [Actinomycetota bacterium]|jgi:hypothetical protein
MSTHPQVEIEKPRFGEVFLLTKCLVVLGTEI